MTECSETSAYKIQTPGNYTEESIQHSEHGESLKSRIQRILPFITVTVQSRAKFLSNQYHKRVGKLFVILGIDLARTIAEMVHVVNNAWVS